MKDTYRNFEERYEVDYRAGKWQTIDKKTNTSVEINSSYIVAAVHANNLNRELYVNTANTKNAKYALSCIQKVRDIYKHDIDYPVTTGALLSDALYALESITTRDYNELTMDVQTFSLSLQKGHCLPETTATMLAVQLEHRIKEVTNAQTL